METKPAKKNLVELGGGLSDSSSSHSIISSSDAALHKPRTDSSDKRDFFDSLSNPFAIYSNTRTQPFLDSDSSVVLPPHPPATETDFSLLKFKTRAPFLSTFFRENPGATEETRAENPFSVRAP